VLCPDFDDCFRALLARINDATAAVAAGPPVSAVEEIVSDTSSMMAVLARLMRDLSQYSLHFGAAEPVAGMSHLFCIARMCRHHSCCCDTNRCLLLYSTC